MLEKLKEVGEDALDEYELSFSAVLDMHFNVSVSGPGYINATVSANVSFTPVPLIFTNVSTTPPPHCPIGMYRSGNDCILCDAGFFKDDIGFGLCTRCDVQRPFSAPGSTSAEDCFASLAQDDRCLTSLEEQFALLWCPLFASQ
eukprot:1240818-Rhodomonas_salina.1